MIFLSSRTSLFALLPLMLAALSFAPNVRAQSDPLTKCLADSTTGKDRKDMARWIFVAMSAHPEIRELGPTSDSSADTTSQVMGALVNRLLTQNCPAEVQAIPKGQGPEAMRRSFEVLGQLAMFELMSERNVATSISRFERYLDRAKINALFGTK